MTDYVWPEDWDTMTKRERQRFLEAHRQRVYQFWQQEAAYQRRRSERVNSFKVTDTLE